jgi:hypothetical protein
MHGITDHPDDFDREWAYRRGYAHGAEAAWRRCGLICPKQYGVKRKCGLPVRSRLGGRNSNQK